MNFELTEDQRMMQESFARFSMRIARQVQSATP